MASSKILFTIAVVTLFVVPSSLATEFVVGDEKGWSLDFDYQGWAAGKEFRVGDKLVSKYTPGVHNVFRVNGTEFQQCQATDNTAPLTTGNDVITLATPGRKWYICGVAKHCAARNMKLSITVLSQVGSPSSAPTPTTSPSSSGARGNAASRRRLPVDLKCWRKPTKRQIVQQSKEADLRVTLELIWVQLLGY